MRQCFAGCNNLPVNSGGFAKLLLGDSSLTSGSILNWLQLRYSLSSYRKPANMNETFCHAFAKQKAVKLLCLCNHDGPPPLKR